MAHPGWGADHTAYRTSHIYRVPAGPLAGRRTVGTSRARCPAGTQPCLLPDGDHFCANLDLDPFNCGACGTTCDSSHVCCRGQCVPRERCDIPFPPLPEEITGGCPPGMQRCERAGGRFCTNTDWDHSNCGRCDNVCRVSEHCCAGQCVPIDASNCGECGDRCGSRQGCCLEAFAGWRCTDLDTAENCGGCRIRCASNETCCAGQCTNVNSDDSHCGRCGWPCPPDRRCRLGDCVCRGDLTDCQGACVDLATNPNHCGRCNNGCPPGHGCCLNPVTKRYECYCGSCGSVCAAGQGCCDGRCRNLDTDPLNCGDCGNACPPEKMCVDGQCSCPAGTTACGSTCCPSGEACCNGACRDLARDGANCGGCGIPCTGGRICQDGHCVCGPGRTECNGICCPAGMSCCSGHCVDLSSDPHNCSACGLDCQGGPCVNGRCHCPPGHPPCRHGCCWPNFPNCVDAPWLAEGFACCEAGYTRICPPVPGHPSGICCEPHGTCGPTGCVY